MSVDHRRRDIGMSEQFLNRADAVMAFKQMSGERMPQHVNAHLFGQPGFSDGRERKEQTFAPT
jgi:hypothetical protein